MGNFSFAGLTECSAILSILLNFRVYVIILEVLYFITPAGKTEKRNTSRRRGDAWEAACIGVCLKKEKAGEDA
jgi:hypothetical protein